jgi:hypothetical protein
MMANLVEFKRLLFFCLDKDGKVFAFNRVLDTVNIIVDSESGIFFVNCDYVRRKLLETQYAAIGFPCDLESTVGNLL